MLNALERMGEHPDAVERVVLELTVGSEPIRGLVEDSAGRRTFAGWLDLVAAIAAAADRPAPPSRQSRPERKP